MELYTKWLFPIFKECVIDPIIQNFLFEKQMRRNTTFLHISEKFEHTYSVNLCTSNRRAIFEANIINYHHQLSPLSSISPTFVYTMAGRGSHFFKRNLWHFSLLCVQINDIFGVLIQNYIRKAFLMKISSFMIWPFLPKIDLTLGQM